MEKFNTLRRDWHHLIINLIKNDGMQVNDEGMCFGGSTTALIAFLRGEESMDAFIKSVNASNEMTPEKMTSIQLELQQALTDNEATFATIREIGETYIRGKREENPKLTENEEHELRKAYWSDEAVIDARKETIDNIHSTINDLEKYFDTKALLQNIMVNFDASEQPVLLPPGTKINGQFNFLELSKNIQPETTDSIQQQKNTMTAASNDFLPYTKKDVGVLISDLVKNCEELRLPLALSLGAYGHKISCSYDPVVKKWLLFDMNQQPYYDSATPEFVRDFIWYGLVVYLGKAKADPNQSIILHTELMTTEFHAATVKNHLLHNAAYDKVMGLKFSPENILLESFRMSVLFRAIDGIPILCAAPHTTEKMLLELLKDTINKDDHEVTRSIASSSKLTEESIVLAIDWALSGNHLDTMPGLINSPALSNNAIESYFKSAVEDKNPELIQIFASSPKLSDSSRIVALMKAIKNNDIDTIIAIAISEFKNSDQIIESGLIHAIHLKNDNAIKIFSECGQLSEETIEDCIKSYAQGPRQHVNVGGTQSLMINSFNPGEKEDHSDTDNNTIDITKPKPLI